MSFQPWVCERRTQAALLLGGKRLDYGTAAMPLLNRCVRAQHDGESLSTVVCSNPSMQIYRNIKITLSSRDRKAVSTVLETRAAQIERDRSKGTKFDVGKDSRRESRKLIDILVQNNARTGNEEQGSRIGESRGTQ